MKVNQDTIFVKTVTLYGNGETLTVCDDDIVTVKCHRDNGDFEYTGICNVTETHLSLEVATDSQALSVDDVIKWEDIIEITVNEC